MTSPFLQYQNHVIDDAVQKQLNLPLQKQESLDDGHQHFLQLLIQKLESGVLDTLNPATLFNHAVYDKLSEQDQEATDLTAVNLMGVIRQLQRLWNENRRNTFQVQNLVETVWQMKSQFEQKHGDVFII